MPTILASSRSTSIPAPSGSFPCTPVRSHRCALLLATVAVMIGLASSASALAGDANAGVLDVITAGDNPAPITEGSGALSFGLVPPVGAACSGDTATAGYSVSSYMVPATVDPADLTFDVAGPVPNGVGSDFRQPLYSDGGTPFLSVNTARDTGFLTNFVPLTLGLFGADGAARCGRSHGRRRGRWRKLP